MRGVASVYPLYAVLLMTSVGYILLIVCLLALGAYFASTEGVITALAGAVLPESLQASGIGILITDHAVRETLGICDRAVLLVEGKLLESGTPSEIAASDRARAVYLGERFKLE